MAAKLNWDKLNASRNVPRPDTYAPRVPSTTEYDLLKPFFEQGKQAAKDNQTPWSCQLPKGSTKRRYWYAGYFEVENRRKSAARDNAKRSIRPF